MIAMTLMFNPIPSANMPFLKEASTRLPQVPEDLETTQDVGSYRTLV